MGIKLLLADDSVTIQKVVGIIFAGDEYELTVVDNGNAAIEKAKEVLPDLILVDALMPGKNGYEVCQAVRQDPALQHLPLLLLTGAFEPFDEEKARQCGADDFITKPFESQQLMDSVKKLLASTKERPVGGAIAQAAAVEEPVVDQDDWAAMTAPDEMVQMAEPASVVEAEPATFAAFESAVAEAPIESPVESPAVHVASTDDLWGAFEMEEVPAADAGSDVQELTASQYVSGGDEFASALAAQTEEPAAIAGDWGVAAMEDEVSSTQAAFADEAPATFVSEPVGEVVGFSEEAFTVEPAAEPEPAFAEPAFAETVFAAPLEETPIEPVDTPFEASPVMEAPAAAPSVAPAGSVTLSDEQLTELVARISRDVIERIAWEVVPDLAETIIKEEIRKIKDGR